MSKIVDWAMELFGLTDDFEDEAQAVEASDADVEVQKPKARTKIPKGGRADYREAEKKQQEAHSFSFAGAANNNTYRSEPNRKSKVVNMSAPSVSGGYSSLNMVIQQPSSFSDAPGIARYLKDRQPVVVNLESLDKITAQKVVDFLGGAVYALDGRLTKVSNGIVVAVPNNMGITGSVNDDFPSSLFAELDI